MRRVLSIGLICCLWGSVGVCEAQMRVAPLITQQPGKDQPKLPQYLPEKAESGLELPPAPGTPDALAGGPEFELKGVVFEGNTVFSNEELRAVAEPFIGHRVGLADLEELRYRLTRLYVDKGYVNSGAILKPDQQVDDGVVTYAMTEGRLDEINISGNGRLRAGYVQKRIWPDSEQPFNTDLLQDRFLLLLQDPLIRKMDGRIRPGAAPGEAILDIDVTRERPYGMSLIVDNHNPPSTGSVGGTVAGWARNLTGYGDLLEASYEATEGANNVYAGYTFLLTPRNTRFGVRYWYSENSVVEEPMRDIDIESQSESLDVALMHPFYRSLQRNLELGSVLSVRESKTYLLGRRFSFSLGDDNGESRVSVLRLVQSYVDRTSRHALALRSTFNFGLDLFDATIHHDGRTDGRYFSWLGQVQYAHRLGEKFGSLILRGDAQLTDDELLTLEQFALGGATTVRGYRENELVRDNGFDVSAEWRYPLWKSASTEQPDKLLQAALFMDFGTAWDKGKDLWDDRLHSMGVGLLWECKRIDAQLYLAHDLKKADPKEGHDLQDDGIHFYVGFHF